MRTIPLIASLSLTVGCAAPLAAGGEPGPRAPRPAQSRDRAAPLIPSGGSTLEELLELATRRHPRLEAQHARWRAQVSAIGGAGRWADPTLAYTFAPLPIQTRFGPNRHTLAVNQRIPWPTRTGLSQDAARASGRAAAREFDADYITVRLEVERSYWSIWGLVRRAGVLERELATLEALAAGLAARVESGAKPASELSRVGLARVRLRDRIERLAARRRIEEAALGRALGSGEPYPLNPPRQPAFSGPPPEIDLDEALDGAPAPPHLRALDEQIDARRAERELAGLGRLPSFEIGAQWALIGEDGGGIEGPERGRDALMTRVGIALPIWSGAARADEDEAEARVVAARAELERGRQLWLERARRAYIAARDAHRAARLIEGTLLAQAGATLSMVRGDYEAGRAEFSAVLIALRDVYELELELARALEAREQRTATWNALLGRPLVGAGESR